MYRIRTSQITPKLYFTTTKFLSLQKSNFFFFFFFFNLQGDLGMGGRRRKGDRSKHTQVLKQPASEFGGAVVEASSHVSG
jgi:hypothetical protein